MLKVGYQIIKDFGALGIGIVQLGIICFFGYKLMYNHLKHISDKVCEISKKLNIFGDDLNKTKERVAKIEGKIE